MPTKKPRVMTTLSIAEFEKLKDLARYLEISRGEVLRRLLEKAKIPTYVGKA